MFYVHCKLKISMLLSRSWRGLRRKLMLKGIYESEKLDVLLCVVYVKLFDISNQPCWVCLFFVLEMCKLNYRTCVWNLSVVRSFFIMSTGGARSLRVLLSFAVGCLLGDVFLHLLPEVWMEQQQTLVGESYCVWRKNCSAKVYMFCILKVSC
jgi:hypothetical protein